jgi:hypothetical protein
LATSRFASIQSCWAVSGYAGFVVCGTCCTLDFSFAHNPFPTSLAPLDNPECSQGPPLTIGWDHFKTSVVPVNVYEEARPPRRRRDELQLGWIERKQILRKTCGTTDEEMRDAICEAQEIKRQRRQSNKRLSIGEYGQAFFKKLQNIRRSSPPRVPSPQGATIPAR